MKKKVDYTPLLSELGAGTDSNLHQAEAACQHAALPSIRMDYGAGSRNSEGTPRCRGDRSSALFLSDFEIRAAPSHGFEPCSPQSLSPPKNHGHQAHTVSLWWLVAFEELIFSPKIHTAIDARLAQQGVHFTPRRRAGSLQADYCHGVHGHLRQQCAPRCLSCSSLAQ